MKIKLNLQIWVFGYFISWLVTEMDRGIIAASLKGGHDKFQSWKFSQRLVDKVV